MVILFLFLEYFFEHLECFSLFYKVRRCSNGNIFYFLNQVSDDLYFFIFWNMIEFGCKYIEINIENAIRIRNMVHIFINLVFILYANHILYESTLEGWLDIVSNITRKIRKIPSIFKICNRLISIKFIFIFPEIGMLIDMNELKMRIKNSSLYCFAPEIEGMIVIIKNYDFRSFPYTFVTKSIKSLYFL